MAVNTDTVRRAVLDDVPVPTEWRENVDLAHAHLETMMVGMDNEERFYFLMRVKTICFNQVLDMLQETMNMLQETTKGM